MPWLRAASSPRRGRFWVALSSVVHATAGADAAGSPLTIRAHDVRATVTRARVAETAEVRTTFFLNAGSDTVVGDYRMAILPARSSQASRRCAASRQTKAGSPAQRASRSPRSSAPSEVPSSGFSEGWVRATVLSIARRDGHARRRLRPEWLLASASQLCWPEPSSCSTATRIGSDATPLLILASSARSRRPVEPDPMAQPRRLGHRPGRS
jgi:hypothetical protein